MYLTGKCNWQKQFTFTPRQFELEGAGFKTTRKEVLRDSQTT